MAASTTSPPRPPSNVSPFPVNRWTVAGLWLGAIFANSMTATWLLRLAYLPTTHWWERLAGNFSGAAMPLMFAGICIGGIGILMLASEFTTRRRMLYLAALVILPVVEVGSIPLAWRLKPGESVRQAGLQRMMMNAEPIIDALEAFQAESGEYPQTLDALVPKHLAAIPVTGCIGYRDYAYRPPGDPGWGWKISSYELLVPTSIGLMNWDEFVFRPERTYLDHHPAGSVERVRDWAYVHE